MTIQRIYQNSKNSGLCEEFIGKNDFETVLPTFCCYVDAFEAAQKIKKSITNAPPTYLKKLQKLHRKKSIQWPMLSFIYNESEITTWMGYNLKTKDTKSKVMFLR